MAEGTFDIFDKFSQSARNVLMNAEQVARGMDKPASSEHILLSLCTTKGTLSYDILKENLISADQIRLVLDVKPSSSGNVRGLSEEGKTVLKRAALLAATYKHLSIDSEHLLMACISDANTTSRKVIGQLGADPEKIKKQLNNLFSDLSDMDRLIREKIQSHSPESIDNIIDNLNHNPRKSKSKTPAIDLFTTDLTDLAKNNKLDNVVGRRKEIKRALQILLRRTKNNPVLVGEPGVGKTAIAEGIAQMISDNDIPAALADKKVLSLDLPQVVAGTVYRGQFEERIKKLLSEINKQKNVILFIDEIHNIVGAGSAEGSIDAANIIKPALARGNIRVIGATTHEEYRKYIEKDSALERRLQKIIVREPSVEESVDMLKGIKNKYEDYHNINISDDAIKTACELSSKYIPDRRLPDKAIDLIDEAAASLTLNNSRILGKTTNTEGELLKLEHKKKSALLKEQYDTALQIGNKINKLSGAIKNTTKTKRTQTIKSQDIARIVEQWTGVPVGALIKDDILRLINIDTRLKKKIIGQDDAIAQIAGAIKRNRIGVADESRPIGSFIFLGPTGVGKTSLAKEIAFEVFGSYKALIKIDMSEFMEKHNISRLVGAPPGYVGYDDAGKLTESIKNRPFSVVLFDEIEKAHPDVFNMLLQIMEDGQLTDAQGRTVSFRHALIIMTSNIGTKSINNSKIGFSSGDNALGYEKIKKQLLKSLDQQINPEFINRLDSIIVFRPLSAVSVRLIALSEVNKLCDRLSANHNIKVAFTEALVDYIAKIGASEKYGARPIKRAIQCVLENKIADYLIKHGRQRNVRITVSGDEVAVNSSIKNERNR